MSDQREQNTQQEASEPHAAAAAAQDDAANGATPAPPAARHSSRPTPRGGAPGVAWLALLLVLVLAAGTGWLGWQAQQREAALQQRLTTLENTEPPAPAPAAAPDFSGIRSELGQLERQLQAAVAQGVEQLGPQLREQEGHLRQLQAQLAGQSAELARITGGDRANWLLAEAQYLLRLANQRLIMTADVASAVALLASADSVLQQLDDVALHPVRRAVARELAALRAVPELDIEGLYLRLAALVDQVPELAIFELPRREPTAPAAEAEDWQSRLRQGYQEALQKLSGYITVRRREQPMEALVDPQWEGLLRQNLVMLLQQAQAALLAGQPVLYRESLQRARRWLTDFLPADEAAARAMTREIELLMDQPVGVELPDISASLRALDLAVDQRLQRAKEQ